MANYRIKVKNPVLGVPITFLDSYCVEQFDIVAFRKGTDGRDLVYTVERESGMLFENTDCKIPQCSTHIAGFLFGHCLDNSDSLEPSINGIAKYHGITAQRKLPESSTYIPGLIASESEVGIDGKLSYKRILIQQKSTLI